MPRKKAQANDAALARLQDYQAVFKTPSGNRVLLDLMDRHWVTTNMGVDPVVMPIKEGERRVVLGILTMLQMDVAQIKEMMNVDREDV